MNCKKPVVRTAALALLIFLLIVANGSPTVLGQDEELIAVLDLAPQGARPEESVAITEQLRAELLKTARFVLVDRSQLDAILDEQALQQSGCTSQECAVQVGRILGIRKIVSGRVTKISDQLWQVSVLLLDVESAETLRAETAVHEGGLAPLLRAGIPELAARLAMVEPPSAAPTPLRAAVRPPETVAPAPPPPQQAAIATTQPGSVWREPITGMEFVYVAGGEYEQGCGAWTNDCQEDEKPTRRVKLSPFWMGRTEVTQGQWKRIMDSNPSYLKKGDDYPVERVSWNDAQQFIARLNAQSRGVTFRLPTEAEWEYACRAGGKPVTYGTATGQLNTSLAKYDSGDGTAAVGSYPPNNLGLHDMSGNVWEWVQDVYNDKAYQSGSTSDPVNERSGAHRVLRGGGWFNVPRLVRCSFRDGVDPGDRNVYLGFRLARTP